MRKKLLRKKLPLDIKLLKIGNHKVLKRLRAGERIKFHPVVLLASSTAKQDIIASYAVGANGFVQKPLDFNEFLEEPDRLGLSRLTVNRTVYGK